MNATDLAERCSICGNGLLVELAAFRQLRRVTSDCRPWPAGGRLGACGSCGALQKPANPQFLAEIDDIYRTYAIYHQAQGVEQAVFTASGLPASRSARLLESFRTTVGLGLEGRMLDIGCGNGAMLRAFNQIAPRWLKSGTEFDEKYRKDIDAIPRTEPLYIGDVENVPGVFDFVSLIHVLEHIIDPVGLLRVLRTKLSPGGQLLVQVPHHIANPFELLIADHRSHFTTTSLSQALCLAGYEIVCLAEDWIPKEISVVARAAVKPTLPPSAGDSRGSRARVTASLEWLTGTAQQLQNLLTDRRIGLFGTSIAGTWLASEAGERIDFFVDEDPHRAGTRYLGRPVHSPTDVPANSIVFVGLPPVIASGICRRLETAEIFYLAPSS
jgi:SAM-dependent methyltransferase